MPMMPIEPANEVSSVLLPEPDGPVMSTISPPCTANERSLKIVRVPPASLFTTAVTPVAWKSCAELMLPIMGRPPPCCLWRKTHGDLCETP